MAKYPATPTASAPATPQGGFGKRKIRCKMCRYALHSISMSWSDSVKQAQPCYPGSYDGSHPRSITQADFPVTGSVVESCGIERSATRLSSTEFLIWYAPYCWPRHVPDQLFRERRIGKSHTFAASRRIARQRRSAPVEKSSYGLGRCSRRSCRETGPKSARSSCTGGEFTASTCGIAGRRSSGWLREQLSNESLSAR